MPEWSVPGYTAIRPLGSGGFGEVVLARHDDSGVLVAIKYLRGELLADPGFAGMFRGEAQVLASMDDPHVVRLYEYVEAPSGAAIVMELVNGVPLREVLAHQGTTAPEAALVVLEGSLLGLAAAHRRGVVHRDYKPENVLVNGGGASKLTDFGLAARTGGHPVPAGTLAYAAPEQLDGAPASPASDVYAATATFYECLTGRPPFSGESAGLLHQHRTAPVPLDPVPAPLRPLIAAGMAKDPRHRPADAITFITQLQAAASSAYGKDWAERGRSHLAEAALLLTALWPAGAPPAGPGAAVDRIALHRRTLHRRISPARAAIAAGTVIAVGAAGAALAVSRGHQHRGPSQPAAAVQPIPLQHPSSTPASLPTPTAATATPATATATTPAPTQPAPAATSPAPPQATTPPPAPTTVTRAVPANADGGVPANISITIGSGYSISGTGSAQYGYEPAAPCTGYPTTHPDGSRYLGTYDCGPKSDPGATLPSAAIGVLIWRIGNGPWQSAPASFTATAAGLLYLAYNDDPGTYGNNSGAYTATVTCSTGC